MEDNITKFLECIKKADIDLLKAGDILQSIAAADYLIGTNQMRMNIGDMGDNMDDVWNAMLEKAGVSPIQQEGGLPKVQKLRLMCDALILLLDMDYKFTCESSEKVASVLGKRKTSEGYADEAVCQSLLDRIFAEKLEDAAKTEETEEAGDIGDFGYIRDTALKVQGYAPFVKFDYSVIRVPESYREGIKLNFGDGSSATKEQFIEALAKAFVYNTFKSDSKSSEILTISTLSRMSDNGFHIRVGKDMEFPKVLSKNMAVSKIRESVFIQEDSFSENTVEDLLAVMGGM